MNHKLLAKIRLFAKLNQTERVFESEDSAQQIAVKCSESAVRRVELTLIRVELTGNCYIFQGTEPVFSLQFIDGRLKYLRRRLKSQRLLK